MENQMEGTIIVLDPGHGGTALTDSFRVGPSGEREEWINLRVALSLKDKLENAGAKVILTRQADTAVGLKERADLAKENKADLFVSIHHNATADTSVNFPIIYFHGNASENKESVKFGKILKRELTASLFDGDTTGSLVSDLVIFPGSGTAVLRHSYGIPGVIGEASFFSNPVEEQKLKDSVYNEKEASAYFAAIYKYFETPKDSILPKNSLAQVEPFPALQEGERMKPEAKKWLEYYNEGVALLETDPDDGEKHFTLSAQYFPDSYIAGKAHYYLYQLNAEDNPDFAKEELKRVKEHYPETELR